MEIQTKLPPLYSQMTREDVPFIRVTGEYFVLKEKSKNEILSVSEKALMSAIDKVNKALQGMEHEFNYKIHPSTGEIIVQVFDKNTHELVREIPPERFIELVEKLQELTVGAIIDEKR